MAHGVAYRDVQEVVEEINFVLHMVVAGAVSTQVVKMVVPHMTFVNPMAGDSDVRSLGVSKRLRMLVYVASMAAGSFA